MEEKRRKTDEGSHRGRCGPDSGGDRRPRHGPAPPANDSGTNFYGNLGGSYVRYSGANLWALQGRVGARFARYFGAEGEAAFGVNTDNVNGVDVKLRHEYAGYGVVHMPLVRNLDIFGRVGYGHSSIRASAPGVTTTDGSNSVNYGGGVQAFFTPKDGIRAEYTRYDFTRDGAGAANVWSVSYVRRF